MWYLSVCTSLFLLVSMRWILSLIFIPSNETNVFIVKQDDEWPRKKLVEMLGASSTKLRYWTTRYLMVIELLLMSPLSEMLISSDSIRRLL